MVQAYFVGKGLEGNKAQPHILFGVPDFMLGGYSLAGWVKVDNCKIPVYVDKSMSADEVKSIMDVYDSKGLHSRLSDRTPLTVHGAAKMLAQAYLLHRKRYVFDVVMGMFPADTLTAKI